MRAPAFALSRRSQLLKIPYLSGFCFAVATLLLGGCAEILMIPINMATANPDIRSLSSTQRTKMSSMEVLRSPSTRPHTALGPVKGVSCRRGVPQEQVPTEADAIEGVKVRAALLDADAVINTVCQISDGIDWANNCWSSIVCSGDAVRYK